MRGQQSRDRPQRGPVQKFFYWFAILLIVFVWIYAFRAYFRHYDSVHPDIAWAEAWVQTDIVNVEGILLWNEDLILSPRDGTVKFPMGRGPLRVPRGAVVAKVTDGGGTYDIKTRDEGYFVAGLDGSEGGWKYSALWPGMKELPVVSPLKMTEESAKVKKNSPVGKLIPQPQDLRFIGYVDMTEGMTKSLASNNLPVKMDTLDTSSKAYVRVYETAAGKAKVYLNVPWFPPEAIMSRRYKLIVEEGETSGIAIPETAVDTKNGKTGAYVVKGTEASFVEIKGRVIGGGRFLATEGLALGDAVIVDAGGAREGRVRLW